MTVVHWPVELVSTHHVQQLNTNKPVEEKVRVLRMVVAVANGEQCVLIIAQASQFQCVLLAWVNQVRNHIGKGVHRI